MCNLYSVPKGQAAIIELTRAMRDRTGNLQRAAILQHGFATIGIIALIDEATGYQDFRQRACTHFGKVCR